MHPFSMVALSLLTGIFIGQHGGGSLAEASILSQVPGSEIFETRNGEGYRFISPLLECSTPAPTMRSPIKQLADGLRTYIDNVVADERIELVSVYYRDLANGPWTGVEFDEVFAPASLLKVPVLIAALKKAESDPSLFDREFEFNSSIPVDDSAPHFVDDQIVFGESYTYRELIERMIVFSDNNAKNILLTYLGDEAFFKVWDDMGISIPTAETPDDFITVREYAAFFRILYNGTYLSREMSEYALNILSRSTFDVGIQKGLPVGVTLASKFGERYVRGTEVKQLHDCGIVYAQAGPYLLCIMTRGSAWEAQADIIAQLSGMVYAFQSSSIGNAVSPTRPRPSDLTLTISSSSGHE